MDHGRLALKSLPQKKPLTQVRGFFTSPTAHPLSYDYVHTHRPMNDFKIALRQFRKSPGFAITVILTISLGIGANTAIFTLVHAILMKSLPVANPASLYRIGDLDDCCVNGGFINDNGDFDLFSYDLYRHFQDIRPRVRTARRLPSPDTA